jgi:hypothetical protein
MMSRISSDSVLLLLRAFTLRPSTHRAQHILPKGQEGGLLKKLSSCRIDTKSISVDLKKS